MRICYSGLRFFSQHVLKRDWHTLALMRAETERRLPPVLSVPEVRRLLKAATPLHNQVYFTTLYSLGLRLQAGLFLQVVAIDSQRMMVHVHRGKGAKDRYVPLPQDTLGLLRHSWATHRNPLWLCPATGRDQKQSATATEPMRRHSVQGAFRTAQPRAGMNKVGVALHTLRHSYATPLLEAGVNLRLIQLYLGHTRLETTMLSLHLTQKGHEDAYERINAVMRGLTS
jgi:integrase/recombinase XerD